MTKFMLSGPSMRHVHTGLIVILGIFFLYLIFQQFVMPTREGNVSSFKVGDYAIVIKNEYGWVDPNAIEKHDYGHFVKIEPDNAYSLVFPQRVSENKIQFPIDSSVVSINEFSKKTTNYIADDVMLFRQNTNSEFFYGQLAEKYDNPNTKNPPRFGVILYPPFENQVNPTKLITFNHAKSIFDTEGAKVSPWHKGMWDNNYQDNGTELPSGKFQMESKKTYIGNSTTTNNSSGGTITTAPLLKSNTTSNSSGSTTAPVLKECNYEVCNGALRQVQKRTMDYGAKWWDKGQGCEGCTKVDPGTLLPDSDKPTTTVNTTTEKEKPAMAGAASGPLKVIMRSYTAV